MGQSASAGVFAMVDESDSNLVGPAGPDLLGRLVDRHAAALELDARQWCACTQDVVQEALVRLAALRQAPRAYRLRVAE